MKISKIEFENFRNFRERGHIDFPTDGTISIVYGMNGAGKTTLHQLFQWVFYGETHFNISSSDNLYNDPYESELTHGDEFKVWGCVYFEHPNEEGKIEYYKLTRNWIYTRGLVKGKSRQKGKFVLLQKMTTNYDWKSIEDAEKAINKILPHGLAPYFFFDGERMIDDLKKKGADSAKDLKNALFALFDLDIYNLAIEHIGSKDKSAGTLLGKLYSKQADNVQSTDIVEIKNKIERCKNVISTTSNLIEKLDREIKDNKTKLEELSAQIGNNQSRAGLEASRKLSKDTIKVLEKNIVNEQLAFGKDIFKVYPMLLMTRLIEQAKIRISLNVSDAHIPYGLEKDLLDSLLQKEEKCICGHDLGENERYVLGELLKAFPPLSQTAAYDRFRSDASRLAQELDTEALETHIVNILEIQRKIDEHRHTINEIDEALKANANIDRLIDKRKELENLNDGKNQAIGEQKKNKSNYEKTLAKLMAKFDELMEGQESSRKVRNQIVVMEKVKKKLDDELKTLSMKYSERLEEIVQGLIDTIASTSYKVSINKDFVLKVANDYDNEYKSEGQRAAVTFSYIGGIFQMLRETEALKNKEYPLVLDGPFSKLDIVQRQNVIDNIPSYAPQIIILTFQDLTDYLPEDQKVNIWSLYGDEQKTTCYAKKGYDPEVFES